MSRYGRPSAVLNPRATAQIRCAQTSAVLSVHCAAPRPRDFLASRQIRSRPECPTTLAVACEPSARDKPILRSQFLTGFGPKLMPKVRLKSRLEFPVVAAVVPLGINAVELAHAGAQVAVDGLYNNMKVVVHQAVGVAEPVMAGTYLAQ